MIYIEHILIKILNNNNNKVKIKTKQQQMLRGLRWKSYAESHILISMVYNKATPRQA